MNLNNQNKDNQNDLTLQPLQIATHNVQGLNNNLKLKLWLEYCNQKQFHIISITETKLAQSSSSLLRLSNPLYKIYTSNCNQESAKERETSMGTAIALHHSIQPYIHNILTVPGTAILIDLFFPNSNKTRIISTYLPSNNDQLSKDTQNTIINWILQAQQKNF